MHAPIKRRSLKASTQTLEVFIILFVFTLLVKLLRLSVFNKELLTYFVKMKRTTVHKILHLTRCITLLVSQSAYNCTSIDSVTHND